MKNSKKHTKNVVSIGTSTKGSSAANSTPESKKFAEAFVKSLNQAVLQEQKEREQKERQ
jgi:hypothetical protein|tara:strand:+ start:448 stop:624 length:177 start_codon:yes stop_codon:yes gene_type:complete